MKKSKVKVYLGFGDPLRCDVSYSGLLSHSLAHHAWSITLDYIDGFEYYVSGRRYIVYL